MRPLALVLALASSAFAADAPALGASDIVSAADHRSGKVSPGEIVVLFPKNVGPDKLMGEQLSDHGRVETLVAGTRVWFDDVPAPIAYAMRGEIGAVVPYEIAGRASVNVAVEYEGVRSEPVTVPVAPSNPSIFTQNRLGTGEAGILNDTGCCNSPENPAVRGSIASVYATGEGLLQGHIRSGSVSAYRKVADYPQPRLPVRLTVGGVPAELCFVAAAPHAVAGLLQINFRVPRNAPVGDAVPLVLTVGGVSSSGIATMAVRALQNQVLFAAAESPARARLQAALKRAGYLVYLANDVPEAESVVGAHPIDLAVIDLDASAKLPESVHALRAIRPRLKVIFAVDNTGPEALRVADLAGAQAILPRPLRSLTLVSRAHELTRRQKVVYDAGPPWPLPRRPQ